jgi:hypothetical protein
MSELQYIKSKRGKLMLIYQNFIYKEDKNLNGKTYWSCNSKYETSCKSRVVLEGNQVKNQPKEHNHLPNQIQNEKYKVTNELKKEIEANPSLSCTETYNKVFCNHFLKNIHVFKNLFI